MSLAGLAWQSAELNDYSAAGAAILPEPNGTLGLQSTPT